MKIKNIIITVIVALLLAALGWAGYYYWQQPLANQAPADNQEQKDQAALNINPQDLLVLEIKNQNLSDYQKQKFTADFGNNKNQLEANISEGISSSDEKNFYLWLALASFQKAAGDYDRAAQLWQWFTAAYPNNSVSPANLGDLYKSFLNNPAESEKYYRIALEREKKDFQIYLGFYELYRYNLQDADKALAVLDEGIANNPGNPDFVKEKINYLKILGRTAEANQLAQDFAKQYPETANQ